MILSCNHISKSFGTDQIINDCSFHLEEREKAAIIGINGAGKSTLLKIIVGELPADSGNVTVSKGKALGYLSQHQNLSTDKTIYDELLSVKQDLIDMENTIRSLEIQMKDVTGDELDNLLSQYTRLNHEFEMNNGYAYKSEVTGVLKGLGFGDEDFSLHVNTLSGGQKTRVALAKLLISKPDIIMLDEPTNHLDMRSKDVLKEAIKEFDGTVVVVSHDREFLDGLVTKVFEFGGGVVKEHIGGIYDFLQKKKIENLNELQLSSSPTASAMKKEEGEPVSENKLSYEAQKELNKKLRKLEKQVADCEQKIEKLEAQIAEVEAKMATPEGASDMSLYEQHQQLKKDLDAVVEEWESVSIELEEAQG